MTTDCHLSKREESMSCAVIECLSVEEVADELRPVSDNVLYVKNVL